MRGLPPVAPFVGVVLPPVAGGVEDREPEVICERARERGRRKQNISNEVVSLSLAQARESTVELSGEQRVKTGRGKTCQRTAAIFAARLGGIFIPPAPSGAPLTPARSPLAGGRLTAAAPPGAADGGNEAGAVERGNKGGGCAARVGTTGATAGMGGGETTAGVVGGEMVEVDDPEDEVDVMDAEDDATTAASCEGAAAAGDAECVVWSVVEMPAKVGTSASREVSRVVCCTPWAKEATAAVWSWVVPAVRSIGLTESDEGTPGVEGAVELAAGSVGCKRGEDVVDEAEDVGGDSFIGGLGESPRGRGFECRRGGGNREVSRIRRTRGGSGCASPAVLRWW